MVMFLCVICDGTSVVSELIFMPHLVYDSIYIVLKEQVLKISFIKFYNISERFKNFPFRDEGGRIWGGE